MPGFILHLLRHGAPIEAGRMIGRTDSAPTQDGVTACLERVAGLNVSALIASDLMRASKAGEAVAEVMALPLSVDPRWRELDFGAWDGLAPADIGTDALTPFWNDPDACPPPGGERWSDIVERVKAAIAALAPVDTLVFTHGGAIRAALAALLGFDHRQVWAFDLPYAALLSLRIWPGQAPAAQIIGLAR
jgi:alpha-ribazole phosphatase